MLVAAIVLMPLLIQDPGNLQRVRESEQRRVDTVARVSPAVCAVMSMERPGGGSGVIIDPRGFLLTNYHVVGGPTRGLAEAGRPEYAPMKIGLPDGRLHRAEVLGIDPGSDLALLSIFEPQLVFVPLVQKISLWARGIPVSRPE